MRISESKIEEVLMLLSFIVSLLAYQNEFILMAQIFFAKGAFDLGCAGYYAHKELKKEKENK